MIRHGSDQHVFRNQRLRIFDYAILLICLVLIPSAVVHGLVGIDERTAFAAFAPVLILISFAVKRTQLGDGIPLLLIAILLLGALGSLIAVSFRQTLMGASLAVAILGGRLLYLTLTNPKALRLTNSLTLILLIGGVVGLLYAAAGGQPLLEVQIGYRRTALYLTTFSFATVGDFIRPSGIFDEPGAFAMFVGIVTIFNDVLERNARLNLALVILMLFTGSLAGLLLAVLYFLFSNGARKYRKNAMLLFASLAAAIVLMQMVFPSNLVGKGFETFYADRMRIEDGRLAGDNRSNQIEEFFAAVDTEILIRGAVNSSNTYDVSDASSNPFSITYGYGLIVSLPYFVLIGWLIFTLFSARGGAPYASLSLLVLMLQRPYLYHMSWSILVCATIFLIHYSLKNHVPNRLPQHVSHRVLRAKILSRSTNFARERLK